MARTTAELHIGFLGRVQVLLAIGTAVAVAGFYLAIYRPQSEQGRDLASQVVARQKELSAETSTTQHLPMVEAQVADLNKRLAGLKSVPTEPDIGAFVRDINRLSQESSLTKLDIQPGPPRQSSLYDERPVTLKFQGDFNAVYEFLQGVEGLQHLTRIQKVDLKGIAGKPGQVSAEVAICLYYHEV